MHLVIKASDLFLVFFYLNVFCKGIGLSNSSPIYIILLSFGIFVLGIKCIATRYSRHDAILILLLSAIGIGSFLVTNKPTLMLTCLCLAGMKDVDIEHLFKGIYSIRVLTFFAVVSLSLLGIIENTSVEMWRNGHFDVRYSLGFGHPNSLHLALFILLATFMYINFEKMNIFKYLTVLAINYFIFKFSGSRTGFIGVILLVFIMYLAHSKSHRIRKILCLLPRYVFLTMVLISFILAWLYDKVSFVTALDGPLNGRLSYSNYFITNYGVSIWGHSLVEENAIFDNGYLFLYIQFGLVGIVFIGGLIYLICKNIKYSMDVRKAALVLTFLIYIFTESFSPNIFMNIILLFASPLLYKELKVDKSIPNSKISFYR